MLRLQARESGVVIGLRVKLILTTIPILIATAAAIWILSSVSYRTGMSRAAYRLLSYKAQQLEEFVANQWDLLAYLQIEDDATYRSVALRSIESFATSMNRGPGEIVVGLDSAGEVVISAGPLPDEAGALSDLGSRLQVGELGWIEFRLGNRPYIGEAFASDRAAAWFVVATDRTEFFRERRQLTVQSVAVLVIFTLASSIALVLVLGSMLAPVARVAAEMRAVAQTKDFSRHVEIEYSDEIGALACEFNNMTTELGDAYERLRQVAEMEKELRAQVTAREHETLFVMGRATEHKDPETGTHIVRVGLFAALIAKALGEDEEQQELIRHATPLHDIGKLGIPDKILLKTGKLTKPEFAQMQTHTAIAYDILKNAKSKFLQAGALIALNHHEYYDGSGYPNGKKGEEIPLFGRIVCVVDHFDAMMSRRPYKEPWPFEKAVAYLQAEAGTRFDPNIVQAFMDNLPEIQRIVEEHNDDYLA